VNIIIPEKVPSALGRFYNGGTTAKMADSLPLLAAAAPIIVIKSDVNSDMDVVEGYGIANGC
jgi:hypothetical protein